MRREETKEELPEWLTKIIQDEEDKEELRVIIRQVEREALLKANLLKSGKKIIEKKNWDGTPYTFNENRNHL